MLWAILLVSPVYAQTSQPDVCLPAETAAQVVVDLEKAKIMQQQVDLLEKQTQELEKQVELLKQIGTLQKEQVDISKQTIDDYKKLMEDKDKICEQKIKDAKPGFWSTVTQYGIFTAIGVVIGVLIM